MLTLKLISEETERVIKGLEKKHFNGAKEAIDKVLAVDRRRREAQQKSDKNKQETKQLSAQIGMLMKQGKKPIMVQQTPVKHKKIGRNEPCPCGSGKKFKNCCGKD